MTRISALLCALLLVSTSALAEEPEGAEESEATEGSEAAEGSEATEESEAIAGADSEDGVSPPTKEASEPSQPADDPVTARLRVEILRYYEGIATEASAAEVGSALESARFMLLDGVSIQRITAAVDKAISLHNPGRRVPFEVAVPLRVLPAAQQAATPAPTDLSDEDALYDPDADERRTQQKASIESRRNRIRLHRQWQRRGVEKRIILAVAVPALVIPYSMGFFVGSIMALNEDVPHSWAWITAVPVVGTLLLGAWTQSQGPGFAVLTITQGVGLAALIVGLALKAERPYEEDPTALRIGKRRDGRTAVTIRGGPMGVGGFLEGRF